MNPIYKILGVRMAQIGVPLTAAWLAWRKFNNRPLRLDPGEIIVTGLGLSAYFATVFVGEFTLGYPHIMTRLPRGINEDGVALTFDDGPHPEVTPQVLDTLMRYDIKATFFLLMENMINYPDLVERIITEGHTIGIHGDRHEPMVLQSSRSIVQIVRVFQRTLGADNFPIRHLRPPYGFKSMSIQNACDQTGLTFTTWSLNSKDYFEPSPKELIQRVGNNAKLGDIVLLHDTYQSTANALPGIIEKLNGRGFKLVRI